MNYILDDRGDLLKNNIIGVHGGVIKIDDITLTIGPQCLAQDTEIKIERLKTIEHFKSLLDLKLIDTAPRIYEFSPNGLRFLKPAKLTIRF